MIPQPIVKTEMPLSCPGCFFQDFPFTEFKKKKKDCCKKWKKEKRCKKCPAN